MSLVRPQHPHPTPPNFMAYRRANNCLMGASDRDCALMLGWVTQVLQTGILRVPDDRLSLNEKIEACAAVNKASTSISSLHAGAFISAGFAASYLFIAAF